MENLSKDYKSFPFHMVCRSALNKARQLIKRGAVTLLRQSMITVEGYTEDHQVMAYKNGKLVCPCKGFQEQGICSHTVAACLILEEERLEEEIVIE